MEVMSGVGGSGLVLMRADHRRAKTKNARPGDGDM